MGVEVTRRAQELTDRATPGPWVFNPRNGVHTKLGFCVATTHNDENTAADADFIAWCRSGVPALLDRLAAAAALHYRIEPPDLNAGFCHGCDYSWPCPTTAVLLGTDTEAGT